MLSTLSAHLPTWLTALTMVNAKELLPNPLKGFELPSLNLNFNASSLFHRAKASLSTGKTPYIFATLALSGLAIITIVHKGKETEE